MHVVNAYWFARDFCIFGSANVQFYQIKSNDFCLLSLDVVRKNYKYEKKFKENNTEWKLSIRSDKQIDNQLLSLTQLEFRVLHIFDGRTGNCGELADLVFYYMCEVVGVGWTEKSEK